MCYNVLLLGYNCHISIFCLRLATRSNSAAHSQPIVIVSRSGSRLYFFSSWTVCGRYFVSFLVLLNLMRISSSCSLSTHMPHSLEHFWATMKVKGGYTWDGGHFVCNFGHFLKETGIWFYINVIYKMVEVNS